MPPHKRRPVKKVVDYPTGDGKPIAETPTHRDNLFNLIEMFRDWYAENPDVYISGNMFLYYEEGNKHKRVCPDVFLTHGVPKNKKLDYYATWREGKGPDLVIELTSRSTRKEDTEKKLRLYQDVLRVPEYFLFDPYAEYLKPPLKGYRLQRSRYVRIKPAGRRLPSEVAGLYLEGNGKELRLGDPAELTWIRTPRERAEIAEAGRLRAVEALQRAVDEQQRVVEDLLREIRARQEAEAEGRRLRQEIEALRRAIGSS